MDNPITYISHFRISDGFTCPIDKHLFDVSSKTSSFATVIGLNMIAELAGLVHDFGKATEEFYRYLVSTARCDPVSSILKGTIDHSTAGAQFISHALNIPMINTFLAKEIICLAVVSHHSGLLDCISPNGNESLNERLSKELSKTRLEEALLNLNSTVVPAATKFIMDNELIIQLNTAIANLRETYDDKDSLMLKLGLLVRFIFSCLIDADRLHAASFMYPQKELLKDGRKKTNWESLATVFELHIRNIDGEKEIDKLRRDISDNCAGYGDQQKGIYQLTVPTGGGKTFSVMRFAIHHTNRHNMERIIYVAPYTSIIDQNANDIRNILETEAGNSPGSIVLEHHSNISSNEDTELHSLLAENWDAPVVFTTMVQFLETLFSGSTKAARRMHQLSNAVLIFDEVQTLPIRCIQMFNVAIRFLVKSCSCSVVLCTATQPLFSQVVPTSRAIALPAMIQMTKNVNELFLNLKRVDTYNKTKPGGWSEEETLALISEEFHRTESVLVIVNTRESARTLFNATHTH